jgi:hypothetical protein
MTASNGRALIVCADCCNSGVHMGRGLCMSCFKRHSRNGTLSRFPLTRGGDDGTEHVGETPVSATAYWRGCRCQPCRDALRVHRNRVDAIPQALRTSPRDPRVLIEQAIAFHGSVNAAAIALARDGVPYQRVLAVWNAMEEDNK